MNTFTRSIDMLQRAMSVNNLRYTVAANNIANSEVPNFKRQEVNFESELKRAFESERNPSPMQLARSDDRHIQLNEPCDWRKVEPRRVTDWASTANAIGNNVDVEKEATDILKIQQTYRLLAQMSNFEFSQLRTAMKK